MDPFYAGIIGSVALMGMILLRVPVAFSLAGVGTLGLFHLYGVETTFIFIPQQIFSQASQFTFAAIPLFLLMGYIAHYADLAKDAYDTARAWFGKVPGGLAVTTVFASAIFGACAGSSLAECSVFSKIAVPEMLASKYNKKLAVGVIGAAGGLGVLIPPSIIMVIYGVMAEQSVGKLLIAGVLPGILYAFVMAASVIVFCMLNPSYGPVMADANTTWKAKRQSLKKVWGVGVLFVIVIGSIYSGLATPDEAAGMGVFGAMLLLVGRRKFKWPLIKDAIVDSVKTTAMIFLLIGGAIVFSTFLSVSGVLGTFVQWVVAMDLSTWQTLLALYLMYLFLGCFLDAISMMVLTLPFVIPILLERGLDLIWFGVVLTMLTVIGCVTPPMGLNCYVMKGALGDQYTLEEIFAGISPFIVVMLLIVLILSIFPEISLFLPRMVMGR